MRHGAAAAVSVNTGNIRRSPESGSLEFQRAAGVSRGRKPVASAPPVESGDKVNVNVRGLAVRPGNPSRGQFRSLLRPVNVGFDPRGAQRLAHPDAAIHGPLAITAGVTVSPQRASFELLDVGVPVRRLPRSSGSRKRAFFGLVDVEVQHEVIDDFGRSPVAAALHPPRIIRPGRSARGTRRRESGF
jgi:hypothetical protein